MAIPGRKKKRYRAWRRRRTAGSVKRRLRGGSERGRAGDGSASIDYVQIYITAGPGRRGDGPLNHRQ
jgi:hypothetical protein